MKKINFKVRITLVGIFFFCIFVAVVITQNNFFNSEPTNKYPSKEVSNLGLNDVPQEPENLSAYQKFQEFWTDVYNQDAINWSYSDWRDYIILQIYNNTEENLNNTIKDDPLFENNINIFTIYVMGKYNGSLSIEDITNLKSELIHNTVSIGDILFLKHDDAQVRLLIYIEVESSPSMWYIADHLEIYLKSENSTGKWYNASDNHYVKVFDIPNLELADSIYTDGKYENHIVGPITINTNAIEENISLVAKVDYFLNFLMEDYVARLELFNLVDDDELSPEILYTYTGNYTDGNPGELIISALDDSGLSADPSGTYSVPNSLGSHNFTFTAIDADNDRSNDTLESIKDIWINITDDDVSFPEISYIYTGDGTDGNPGELIVNASDISGLSLDPSGTYYVPNTIGNHKFVFTASDADDDRPDDVLNTTITVWINITDDDTVQPEISYIYNGDGTDGNPGELIVNASDISGLSFDPSGIYHVPNTIGNHKFVFTASDADDDRPDDVLNTTITVWINITDDDTVQPEISYIYTGDGTDGNPGELIVNASDISGLSFDPSGIYHVPNTIGNHKFVFTASDADDDRPDDVLNTTITVWINITDDDISFPEISYIYTGDGTDGNPGELIVNASDISGLSLDPSGTYHVPNTIGNHTFTFTACDMDNDRLDDILNITIIIQINIIDDDDEGPIIKSVNITNNRVYDHYEFIIIDVLAEDKSGISELFIEFNNIWYYDDNGDGQFFIENPRTPGIYNFSVVVIDADNDREGDHETTQVILSFEVFDDDITPPNIYLYYENYNYQISILDNDGMIDSKATGEYHLIDEEGMILESGIMSLEDFKYLITIPLKPGNYTLEVYSTNNDIEWEGDEEFNVEIFDISVGIKECFQKVDTLIENLIIYVDANLYSILADNIRFKLRLAQEDLRDAYDLVEIGNLKCCLFNELIVQAIIEFVEFETEIYNNIDLIVDEIRDEIITSLHEIRNFVVLLIGTSVDYVLGLKGISSGYNIALIEVELLNLADFVEELEDLDTKYLEKLIRLSALHLELAIIKLSRGINPDSTLSNAQKFIERAKEEVNNLLENYEITEDIVTKLLETLDYCYFKIEEIKLGE